jgi:hypothetical protein
MTDIWTDMIGLDVTDARRAELLAAFETIAAEIRKLRTLDLDDLHPAVVFDPTMAERTR